MAAAFVWPSLGRQVRSRGHGPRSPSAELAEELFAAAPRHQLQAHVSRQGEEIESLDQLRVRLEALRAELGEGPVPCPEDWGAVRLMPERVELWEEAYDRLHEPPALRGERRRVAPGPCSLPAQVSSISVTGPSLTRATPMQAPKTPLAAPRRSQKRS